jgi:predicted component of viral defense system (DUF524 family)
MSELVLDDLFIPFPFRRWQEMLSEADRQRMLADIAVVALAVGRDLFPNEEFGDLDIGDAPEGGAADICPRERLGFLSAFWPRLSAALTLLEAAPAAALRSDTRVVPIERARRVTPKDLLRALRAGARVRIPSDSSLLATRLNGSVPRRIAERVTVATHDTPANRMVKAILVRFARDLVVTAELATVSGASFIAAEAHRLRHRIRRHLRRDPWRSLPLAPTVPPLPASVRTYGAYRLIHDAYRRYRRGFAFDWANPLFTLPTRETWLLYEYWCLFRVADALRALGFRATESDAFTVSRAGLTFTFVKGRASRVTFRDAQGRTLALTYNRYFPRSSAVPAGWRSRSHAMRPDIALEADGRLFLFDAKFRAYVEVDPRVGETGGPANLPLVDDINQMHAYRDGIFRGDVRVVRGAWLLYAGRRGGPNHAVIAYPEAIAEQPFGDGEVGALLLRPDGESLLPDLVGNFLDGG